MDDFEQAELTGDWTPRRDLGTVLLSAILVLVVSPWLVMGVGLLVVGARSLADQRNFDDLWICFPPGVILTGFACYLLYSAFWNIPRRTATRFILSKDFLVLETLAGTRDQVARKDLEVIRKRGFRRRKRGRGFYVVDRLGNWWYINSGTTNFSELLERLSSDQA